VGRLIHTAFFEAILPGFERDADAKEQTDPHG
jgi:hypothetical protein